MLLFASQSQRQQLAATRTPSPGGVHVMFDVGVDQPPAGLARKQQGTYVKAHCNKGVWPKFGMAGTFKV
jgi:hypothetical protein